jgi:phosphatidate cytidylyltransferase
VACRRPRVLRWRTATAAILAPIVLGAIVLGGRAGVLALVLLVTGLAAYELSQALKPLPFPAAFGAGAIPVLLSIPYGLIGIMAGVCFSLPWALFWLAGKPETRTLRAVLAILLMALWVGASLAHLGLIADSEDEVVLILVAVVGPWVSDAGAYFAGRLFGRHPLVPNLSPKKTVEGSVGGLLLTMLVVGWAAYWFLGFPIPAAAAAGVAISIFSQGGDLFESLLKRILNIKDLGRSLPGHGGILDRIDSLLFTAPAVYYMLLFL